MGVGFEGAGEIVEVGAGVDASNIGKAVAFSDQPHGQSFTGTWRQFKVANFEGLLVYPGSVDFDKICSSIVNPLTASGFIDTCQKNKVTAVIQDAAASALGKQFIRLCKHYGITLINVV